ncbi:hypothetical protein TI04_03635 [Achromatium sp. WMS2]|nr:hypothetical protein TI04_03635 [Achromatium sp. WMS2]
MYRIQFFPQLGLALLIFLYGCSSRPILSDRQVEYRKQKVATADLEVPPDLTTSNINDSMPIPGTHGTATYSQYQAARANSNQMASTGTVLPDVPGVKVLRDGDRRWLEVAAPPDQVWNKIVDFWRENGIILLEQNPATGVMRTDWIENRANIKQNFLTDFLRRALDSLYSSGTRDQFRVRLEPSLTPGSTDLYLTHRGLEEKMVDSVSGTQDTGYWVPRPNDPGLEAEILRRIMVYMGLQAEAAKTSLAQAAALPTAQAELTKTANGNSMLLIKRSISDTWTILGIALERLSFAVEDRDRTAGLYYVRYDDPLKSNEGKGFFSRLAFWRADKPKDNTKYRLLLQAKDQSSTMVTVLNDAGQPETSDTATRILTLLQEQAR